MTSRPGTTPDRPNPQTPAEAPAETSEAHRGTDPGPLDRYGLPRLGDAPWHLRPPLLLLHGYKRCISPLLPNLCRFQPTCSQYSAQAYRAHGLWRGSVLTAWRLLRCSPFGKGGHDPVPPRRKPTR